MNQRVSHHAGDGNGSDTMLGFSQTQERRVVSLAKFLWWLVGLAVGATAMTLGAYYAVTARQAQAEQTLSQQQTQIQKLDADKQSKEAADLNQRLILDKLDAMDRNVRDLRDDVKEMRSQLSKR